MIARLIDASRHSVLQQVFQKGDGLAVTDASKAHFEHDSPALLRRFQVLPNSGKNLLEVISIDETRSGKDGLLIKSGLRDFVHCRTRRTPVHILQSLRQFLLDS